MGVSLAAGVVLLGVLAILVGWVNRAGGWLWNGDGFLIRGRGRFQAVEVRGAVPKSKVQEIREFCHRDLKSDRPFSIRGSWGPEGRLSLRWTGQLTPAQRQRARNFLIDCLK